MGPVTCNVTSERYEALLRNPILLKLQQHQYVDRTIFKQDGAPSQIATVVKQLLNTHFKDDMIISFHLPHLPSVLNPLDSWLWGVLKISVCCGRSKNPADLMANITHHIHYLRSSNIPSDLFLSLQFYSLTRVV